jgi:hypothetical protein
MARLVMLEVTVIGCDVLPGISPRRTSQGGVAIHVIARQHYLGTVLENNETVSSLQIDGNPH